VEVGVSDANKAKKAKEDVAGYQLRSNPEIISIIKSAQSDEPLIYFVAGVLLGKNRREYIAGSHEEAEFYAEIIEILDEAGRAMRKLARRKSIPLERGDHSSIES
jgi:hypothetical protein